MSVMDSLMVWVQRTEDRENIFQFMRKVHTSDHRSIISKKELYFHPFLERQKVPLFRHLIVHLGHLSPEFCGASLFRLWALQSTLTASFSSLFYLSLRQQEDNLKCQNSKLFICKNICEADNTVFRGKVQVTDREAIISFNENKCVTL